MLAHRAATQRARTPARVWPCHARRAWHHGRGSSLPCQCACSDEGMLAQWPGLCIAAGPQAQATHTHGMARPHGMAWPHGMARPHALARCVPSPLNQHPANLPLPCTAAAVPRPAGTLPAPAQMTKAGQTWRVPRLLSTPRWWKLPASTLTLLSCERALPNAGCPAQWKANVVGCTG
jgi:hypothetical protein